MQKGGWLMTYQTKTKPPGERWRKLNLTYTPRPKPGDHVLLRNDERDVVKSYEENYKMYTLKNHQGLFSGRDLLVITETEK
jgi:hypothetical protein